MIERFIPTGCLLWGEPKHDRSWPNSDSWLNQKSQNHNFDWMKPLLFLAQRIYNTDMSHLTTDGKIVWRLVELFTQKYIFFFNGSQWVPMLFWPQCSSKYLLLCSAEGSLLGLHWHEGEDPIEACFRHRIKNKKGNCDFLSHNSDFISQNRKIWSQNCVI